MIDLLNHPIYLTRPRRLTETSAWHMHIPFAFYVISVQRPRRLVELGTKAGDSYCAMCQALSQLSANANATAVDSWEGDSHMGQYGTEVLEDLRSHHDPLYGSFSELLQTTFDAAAQQVDDQSIDLLHIDGHHTYEAVSHDFKTWLPKMRANSTILLHNTHEFKADFGVHEFWRELRAQYPTFEIEFGHGLGVVLPNADAVHALRPLVEADREEKRLFRRLFKRLGESVEREVEHLRYERQMKQLMGEKEALEKAGSHLRRNLKIVRRNLEAVGRELEAIKSSVTWRVGSAVGSRLNRIFAPGSRGRRTTERVVKGIVDDGENKSG